MSCAGHPGILRGRPDALAFPDRLPAARADLLPALRNAHFGSGLCESGEDEEDSGVMRPFALNVDTVAHGVGHGLVFAMAGIPRMEGLTTDYLAFHESASNRVAIV